MNQARAGLRRPLVARARSVGQRDLRALSRPVVARVTSARSRMAGARRTAARGGQTRHVLIVVAVALSGFLVCDLAFGELVHDRRQEQLAADYKVARPWMAEGRALAIMQIPSIGVNEVLVEGVRPEDLRAGVAHWRGTPDPGKPGNAVVLGHRRRFGGPLGDLDDLLPGDAIVVKRKGSPVAVSYTVAEVLRDVPDSEARRLLASDPSALTLTLVTSEHGWWRPDHLVVVATAPLEASPIAQIDNDAAPIQPDSFDPGGDPFFNRDAVLGGLWLALAVATLGYTRRHYPQRVALIVVTPLLALGTVYGWLALGRLLQPTL